MIPLEPISDSSSSSSSPSPSKVMSLMPQMTRPLARLVTSLAAQPASTVTTLLYCTDLLPQHLELERLVRRELLERENYLFHFLVSVLRCFWYVRNIPSLLLANDASFLQETLANLRAFTFFPW